MANINNGGQIITFRYQQEGIASGFNKLLHGVIPTGVINGGTITRESDTEIHISPMEIVMTDGNVTIHVQTTEDAIVEVNDSIPFIIATFNWADLVNNYVTFEAVNYTSLSTKANVIILGRCEFTGTVLSSTFDYTRKTWSSIYYNNEFLYSNNFGSKSPSFLVTPLELSSTSTSLGFNVGIGKGIINGKEVNINNPITVVLNDDIPTSTLYFQRVIETARTDIAILKNDGTVEYIMGEDSINHYPPIFPSNSLVLAKFTFIGPNYNVITILGSNIEYIYNNNFISGSGTVGHQVGDSLVNEHTLYL